MTPFESEGVYAGIPYRVLPDCSIEAMLSGGLVRFKNIDQFLAAADNATEDSSVSRLVTSYDVPENAYRHSANIPATARPLDYYSILLDAIQKAENNSAQLRALVYERARYNLKREFLFGYSSLGLQEIVQHVNDFELAVARIEANAVESTPRSLIPHAGQTPVVPEPVELHEPDHFTSGRMVQIMPPAAAPPIYDDYSSYQRAESRKLDQRLTEVGTYLRTAAFLVGALLVAIVAIGIVLPGTLWHSEKKPSQIETAQPASGETVASQPNSNENSAKPTREASQLPFPIPTSFGIYALSNNQLIKLETLPIKIPDPRVALSAEITKPSTAILSDNKPAFILFRRDLLNNAPDKLTLRIVAQVVRETKFVGGKPVVANFEGSWRIRNMALEYKISPIDGQPEMVVAHAADGPSLAPGRYALVVNGSGYDFTIDGLMKSPAHCLEKFEALNGTVFSECRQAAATSQASKKL